MVNKFTKQNFDEEVKNYKGVVLVDFYADWCGPCKMMSPVVDEIANENEWAKVGKINCDEEIELAEEFGVMSIPTLIIFKNGEIAKTFVGVTPKEEIINALKSKA
jgi:thioredoxin 1